jgi:hypothetical protein
MVGDRTDVVRFTDRLYRVSGICFSQYPDYLFLAESTNRLLFIFCSFFEFGGVEVSEAKRLRALEEENSRLKRLVADQAMQIHILTEVNAKKW